MNRDRETHDDWLWDRSGAADPEVERLEELLGGFGLKDDAAQRRSEPVLASPAVSAARRPRPRKRPTGGLLRPWIVAATVLVGLGIWALVAWSGSGRPRFSSDEFVALVVDRDGVPMQRLRVGQTFATADAAARLRLGSRHAGFDIELALTAGTQISIDGLNPAAPRIALADGTVDASVAPALPPGSLVLATPFGDCVDLGCRYVLKVDARAGTSLVDVTVGRIAFETTGRRVLVPAGARVLAQDGTGIGTPRFAELADPLVNLLRKFDETPQDMPYRPELAAKFAAVAAAPRDTLPLWHLLQDADPEVREAALAGLARIAGYPPTKMLDDAGAWLDHLEPLW